MMPSCLWTLCIGVNDYGGHAELPNLQHAVNDACYVHKTLTSRFDVEATLMAAPRSIRDGAHPDLAETSVASGSRQDILSALSSLRRNIERHESMLVFFSGHGVSSVSGAGDGRQYRDASVLPYGAVSSRISSFLTHRQLLAELMSIQCAHQLLILDCCFGIEILNRSQRHLPRVLIRSGPRLSVISASDFEHPEAFDGLVAAGDGKHSPLAAALVSTLEKAAATGEALTVDMLFERTRGKVVDDRPANMGFWPVPQFRPDVYPGRTDFKPLHLRPLVFQVETPELLVTQTNMPVELSLGPAQSGQPLDWEVRPRNLSAQTVDVEPCGGDHWRLTSMAPGEFEFELVAIEPQSGSSVCRRLVLVVEYVARPPLRAGLETLPLCTVGQQYKATIPISGGVPPYTLLKCDVPSFLRSTLAEKAGLQLLGSYPRPAGMGTPISQGVGPIVRTVALKVADKIGDTVEIIRQITIVTPDDYCFVEKGVFKVGYSESEGLDKSLTEVHEESVKALTLAGTLPPFMVQWQKQFGEDWAHQVARETSKNNPSSDADTESYYIKKYPVSNSDWLNYLKAHPKGERPAHWGPPGQDFSKADAALPVVNLSFAAIQNYLAWKGTRLPTAWEWERAARGSDGRLFPWGSFLDTGRMNVVESRLGKLVSVDYFGEKAKSPHGCYDMVGNAAEWVDQRRFRAIGRSGGGNLVQPFRGGSFRDFATQSLTFRDSKEVGVRYGDDEDTMVADNTKMDWIGFRDVIDLEGELSGPGDNDNLGTRLVPRATLGWSYPVFRSVGENAILTLTPRAMATATVGSLNTDELPNEDSQSVEFDATALFRPELAAGRDRFDDGQRVDVGLEAALDLPELRLTGIVGQSYRVNSSRNFGDGTGLDEPFSDVVVGIGAQVQDWIDGATRARWDTSTGELSAVETRMRLGYNPIQLSFAHTMLDARKVDGESFREIHQIDATLRAQFDDNWAGFVRHQHDLDLDQSFRSQIGFAYADECLRFETIFTRDSFENAEVQDNDSIIFRIVLNNFGAGNNAQDFARE